MVLSRKTYIKMIQNLFWAFIYNIIGIPIAAGVLTIFNVPMLPPALASLFMALSSVSVVTSALLLYRTNLDEIIEKSFTELNVDQKIDLVIEEYIEKLLNIK